MISLNQILLLEQKVESAVEKIKRLQAENDALRKSCEELTNALSVKSEQLSQFEQEQSQIESGIKNALERLTAIENSVLEATSQTPQDIQKPAEQTSASQVTAAQASQGSQTFVEQTSVEQPTEHSFKTTSVPPAPQSTISQNNTFSAPQENAASYVQESISPEVQGIEQVNIPTYTQENTPQGSQASQQQPTEQHYTQESVPQNSQVVAQENATTYTQENTPQDSQASQQQSTEQHYTQESVPQNSQVVAQENAPSYMQESISPEVQNFVQQNNAEQQEPSLQPNVSYGKEPIEEENTIYDQEVENSFDDGLLFSPGPEDTEIDDFYEDQESPENNSSNNEQDASNLDIY